MLLISRILIALTIFFAISFIIPSLSSPSFAQENAISDEVSESNSPSPLFLILRYSNYLILLTAIVLNIMVIRSFSKGALNIVFVSFGFSLALLGMYMAFMYLNEMEFYKLNNVSFHIWAHGLVYLSFLSIVWGGYRVKQFVEGKCEAGFRLKDKILFASFILLGIATFFLAPTLEAILAPIFVGSVVDKWGIHHLGAFVLGAIAAWYLFYIKGQWGLISKSITLIIGFMLFLSLQHLWETFTESIPLITIADNLIENIEQIIIMPALILFVLSQWQLVKFLKTKADGTS